MSVVERVARRIAAAQGASHGFVLAACRPVSGGCINRCFVLQGRDARRYFVKLNRAALAGMFAAEFEGLQALGAGDGLRVPRPLLHGVEGGEAFLVMEYLDLAGAPDGRAWQSAGAALARQHRCTAGAFGWTADNSLGSTGQPNTWHADWVEFWRVHRLGHQLGLAAGNGHARALARGEVLVERLEALFAGYRPVPALLHGDLWRGNIAFDGRGEPAVFDPAVYFGDRETDLAMTHLFGGFDAGFHAAYAAHWPLDPGYPVRRTLYNLYHVLNHLNLFGGGYLAQARSMVETLLAELG